MIQTDDDCDGEPVNKFCCGKQGVCVNEEADSDLTACGKMCRSCCCS